MPLIIEDQPMQALTSVSDFIQNYPQYKTEAKKLKAISPIIVSADLPYLYIHQMECAFVSADDSSIDMIGLDEMTTCCGIVVRHTGSFAMGAGHFDGHDTKGGVRRIVDGVVGLTEEWMKRNNIDKSSSDSTSCYEVYIVGGFSDKEKISNGVVIQILIALHQLDLDLQLKTACICSNNTYYKANEPQPRVTGLLCNVKTGQIVPALFSFRGPIDEIRKLRYGMRPPMMMPKIYDPLSQTLEIKPFECIMSDWTESMLERLLNMDKENFLACMSTSPFAEGPDYVMNCKRALKFLKDNKKTLFKSGKSYKFIRVDGDWKQIEP